MATVKLLKSWAAQPDLLPNLSHVVFNSFTNKELLRLTLFELLYSLDFHFCPIQREKQ